MDPENQRQVKNIAEHADQGQGTTNVIVVLGASDIEGALISAETVTVGDPSFAGPLAGVSLRLPVYHILEPEIRDVVPPDIYNENVGIWSMVADIERIGREFKAIREKATSDA
jgi:betaine reductase